MSPPPWSTWCTAVKEPPRQLHAELDDVDECPFCMALNPGRGKSQLARGQSAGGGQSSAKPVVIDDEDQPGSLHTNTNPAAPVRTQDSNARLKAIALASKNQSIDALNKAVNLNLSHAGGYQKAPPPNKLSQSSQQAKADRTKHEVSHGIAVNVILVQQSEKWFFDRKGVHRDIEMLNNKQLGDSTVVQISYGPIVNMNSWIQHTLLDQVPLWLRNPSVREDIESISLATAFDKKSSRLTEVSVQVSQTAHSKELFEEHFTEASSNSKARNLVVVLHKITEKANIVEQDVVSDDDEYESPAKMVKEEQVIVKKEPGTSSKPLRKISKASMKKSLPVIKKETFKEEPIPGEVDQDFPPISGLISHKRSRSELSPGGSPEHKRQATPIEDRLDLLNHPTEATEATGDFHGGPAERTRRKGARK